MMRITSWDEFDDRADGEEDEFGIVYFDCDKRIASFGDGFLNSCKSRPGDLWPKWVVIGSDFRKDQNHGGAGSRAFFSRGAIESLGGSDLREILENETFIVPGCDRAILVSQSFKNPGIKLN